MFNNNQSPATWLLPVALLCFLSACGGETTISSISEAGIATSFPDSNNTIASDSVPPVSIIVDDVTLVNSDSAPVTETTQNDNSAVANEGNQTNDEPAVVVIQDPPPEQGTQTPEVAVSPADTGSDLNVPPMSTTALQVVPAESREYTMADITDLILVTGQSNALGADTSFDAAKDAPHERVFAFTENGWRRADLHQVWDLGWFPRTNPGQDPSNNFSLHAAKEIASRRSDRVIGFVLATAPGEGIEHWDSNGEFFAEIDRKVLDAINQLPHKSGVDGIFWHQGESDDGDPGYGQKLDQVIASFRQQNWFAANRPFICGETAVFEVVNQQLAALNNNGDRWSACVDSAGLQTREDGFHFNAEGLRELGRRYGARYLGIN